MDASWLRPWRDAIRALNRPPGPEWTARLAHHGSRLLGVVLFALLIPFLFPRDTLPEFEGLKEGAVATHDVIARIPFTVYKSEDQLAAERRDAEAGLASIFAFDPNAADTAVTRVRALFARLDSAARAAAAGESPAAEADATEEAAAPDTAGVREVLAQSGIPSPSEDQLIYLADAAHRQTVRRALETAFRTLIPRKVVSIADFADVGANSVIVRRAGRDRLTRRDSIMTVGDFTRRAVARAPRALSSTGLQLYQTLLVRFVQPSLRLDRDATLQAREQARRAVEAAAGYVLQGERIVTAHERIGRSQIDKLAAYRARLAEEGLARRPGVRRHLGSSLLALSLLGLLGLVLYFFRRRIYEDLRGGAMIYFLVLLVLAGAGVVAKTSAPAALVPVAFAGLLVAALFDGLLALVVVMTLAAMLLGQPGFSGLEAPLLALFGGATAALALKEVRRRSQSWILIALITGAYVVAGTALLLLGDASAGELLRTAIWGGVNATASTALAMGAALPALEKFTGRTSSQTLLELADLNRPLLRRLSREAPGTYAHSINIANLAEAASEAIGADALLARVGSYYHDIGKLLRPQYFVENQPQGLNPHDRLKPIDSAEVIREHVREGLRLAEQAKLPPAVKAFICEHHGTRMVSFFYDRARESEPALAVDPSDYSYTGPKPQTRETAVVMLADSVESVSRTLAEPTPERIRAMVDHLVRERSEEGQLNECPLTLRDVDVIKAQFVRVLKGFYHHRIEYASVNRGARSGAPSVPPASTAPTRSAASEGDAGGP
ncbi:MAG: HD family phosphohydrolase [Gemmatimonadota bacterium]